MSDKLVNAAREYARYRSIVLGDPYLPSSVTTGKLPKDGCIICHNGTLTASEKRAFGRNPFITPGSLKSETLRKPANPLPCLYLACRMSEQDNIPLSKLTIGHMQIHQNRMNALTLAEAIAVALGQDVIPRSQMNDVWSDMKERGYGSKIASTVTSGLKEQHRIWYESLSRLMTPSDELIKEREQSGWGEW